jgi:uncharacterized protein YkuJ
MPTIQFGNRQVKVKVNPSSADYIVENASRQFEPQWNEQVFDENGNAVLDVVSEGKKNTFTLDVYARDDSGINTDADIAALVGTIFEDDNNVKIGVIKSVNDATPAGRGLKLNLSIEKFTSITY